MGGLLVIIGLIVLVEAHSTTPGIYIGLALVAIGALVVVGRKEEDL